jgi:hypothetical protein
MNRDAAHHAHQQCGDHDAPKTAKAADHHNHKGDGDDLISHRRMHDGDRREECSAHRGHADAEHDDGGHVGLQPDAQRRDHVRPLNAGPHHAAERGLVQQQPDADQHHRHHRQQHHAVARKQEIADDDRAAKHRRYRCRQWCRAPRDTDRLFGDHGETEGDQQAQDRIGGVETAQDVPFKQDAQHRDRDRRQHHGRAEAEVFGDFDRCVSAERVKRAVRQVHHTADAEDQRQPERDQEIIASEHEAVYHLFQQEPELHSRSRETLMSANAPNTRAPGAP